MKKVLLGCIVIGSFMLCCCAGSAMLMFAPVASIVNDQFTDQDFSVPTEEIVLDDYEEPILSNGTIEGSLGYPSEFIPSLEICAERIDGTGEFCTTEIIESELYTNGQGYILSLPEGDYYVYSVIINESGERADNYKAYYSDFVKCGLSVDCTTHDPVAIRILPEIEINNVDPIDWYNQ